MCILLKLDYAKFGVFNLFFTKVIEEKPMGGGGGSARPLPLGKRRVKFMSPSILVSCAPQRRSIGLGRPFSDNVQLENMYQL